MQRISEIAAMQHAMQQAAAAAHQQQNVVSTGNGPSAVSTSSNSSNTIPTSIGQQFSQQLAAVAQQHYQVCVVKHIR